MPALAETCAIPCPMRPAPITPTFFTSKRGTSFGRRAPLRASCKLKKSVRSMLRATGPLSKRDDVARLDLAGAIHGELHPFVDRREDGLRVREIVEGVGVRHRARPHERLLTERAVDAAARRRVALVVPRLNAFAAAQDPFLGGGEELSRAAPPRQPGLAFFACSGSSCGPSSIKPSDA